MSNDNQRIFLGNLNYRADESDIRQAFETLNVQVDEIRIPIDGEGRRKGFAFVDISPGETLDIGEIISIVNGVEICGRPCRAARAEPKRDGGQRQQHQRRKGGRDFHDARPGRKARERYEDEWNSDR